MDKKRYHTYGVGDSVRIPNTNIVIDAPTETGLCKTLDAVKLNGVPVKFDPTKKAHRRAFKIFKETKRWPDGVRFEQEWPHTSVVATVEQKLVEYALRNV